MAKPNIPLEWVVPKYFGLSYPEARRRAPAKSLPCPTFRLGGQKSPWLVSATDLAQLIAVSPSRALIVAMVPRINLEVTKHLVSSFVSYANDKLHQMPNNPAEIPLSQKPIKIGVSDGNSRAELDRKVSVAPMMDWTDRHCRYFLRGFSPRMLLYTEMVTAAAILRGDRERLLRHSPEEHPLALQLGGSDPEQLAAAARIGADSGYVEINLNCGCPSDRVHAGAFGACLMREPERVADCVAAMRAVVPAQIPVTVKMRIGVLEAGQRSAVDRYGDADYENLQSFVRAVQGAGCRHIIVHARQAVLGGLSPRENREIPPLRYEIVRRLKQDFPSLWIAVNGGLRDIEQCRAALEWADGIMLGREAYHRPQVLGELHAELYQDGWHVPLLPALLSRAA